MYSSAKVAVVDVEPGVCGGCPKALPTAAASPAPVDNKNDSTPNAMVFTIPLITSRLRLDIESACKRIASDSAHHQQHD